MRKLLFLAILFFSVGVTAAQDHPPVYVILNGTIIDGTGAAPAEGIVLVIGNQITGVGDVPATQIPPDAEVIDGTGATVLPGVLNVHTHYVVTPKDRLELFTQKGVTGLCDMATDITYMFYSGLERTSDGIFAGRFSMAGPIMTVPGGYPTPYWGKQIAYEVSTPEEARQGVLDLIDKGAKHIKIALEPGGNGVNWPVLSLEEIQAITQTAHENGLLVHAHLQAAEFLQRALDGGVDVIEHTPVPYDFGYWSNADALRTFWLKPEGDAPIPDEELALLGRMVDGGVMMTPTLDVIVGSVRRDLPQSPANMAYEAFNLAVVRAFHDMGGQIAVGNDYGNPGVEAEMPVNEMLLLQEAGLTPLEVITAATSHSAQLCGMTQVGTLEAGKFADLIIVNGNPLDDLSTMANVSLVMVNGEIVKHPE